MPRRHPRTYHRPKRAAFDYRPIVVAVVIFSLAAIASNLRCARSTNALPDRSFQIRHVRPSTSFLCAEATFVVINQPT